MNKTWIAMSLSILSSLPSAFAADTQPGSEQPVAIAVCDTKGPNAYGVSIVTTGYNAPLWAQVWQRDPSGTRLLKQYPVQASDPTDMYKREFTGTGFKMTVDLVEGTGVALTYFATVRTDSAYSGGSIICHFGSGPSR